MASIARDMWVRFETYHDVTYFTPESRAATDALGCKGGWMGYFGMRAAPLGAAPPELVTATFYNFHPSRVARVIPDAWEIASPQRFLETRLSGVDVWRIRQDAVRCVVQTIEHSKGPGVVVHQNDFVELSIHRNCAVNRVGVPNRANRWASDHAGFSAILRCGVNLPVRQRIKETRLLRGHDHHRWTDIDGLQCARLFGLGHLLHGYQLRIACAATCGR